MRLFQVGSYLLDVGHIWVVFGGHEQQVEPLIELDPVKGGDSHVQKDSKEHGQGDLPEQIPDNQGETWGRKGSSSWPRCSLPPQTAPGRGGVRAELTYKQGNQQPSYPLLLDLLDLGLVPRRHSLAHHGERVGVSDGAHGGSSQPGQAKEGTDAAHGHDEQQVQVEAGALLQHPLLLGDDQPGGDRCALTPSLADHRVSLEHPVRNRCLLLEPGGACPFRKSFVPGKGPPCAALPVVQDSFQPPLCPSQQTSVERSTAYRINSRGAWEALLVKRPTLGFGSGRDARVVRSSSARSLSELLLPLPLVLTLK